MRDRASSIDMLVSNSSLVVPYLLELCAYSFLQWPSSLLVSSILWSEIFSAALCINQMPKFLYDVLIWLLLWFILLFGHATVGFWHFGPWFMQSFDNWNLTRNRWCTIWRLLQSWGMMCYICSFMIYVPYIKQLNLISLLMLSCGKHHETMV